MKLSRSFDAAHANAIMNAADVRPFVSERDDCAIDLTQLVHNKDNFLYLGDWGLEFYHYIMPGTFEVHSACLKQGRGEWMAEFSQASLDAIFTQSNAWEILTRIPHGNLGALALARLCGFSREFDSLNPCRYNGAMVTPSIWRLSIHEWVKRSDTFLKLGEWMHGRLAEEATKLGIRESAHAPDDHHSCVAGMAYQMARSGQPLKAVLFYNRWAVLARHATIRLVASEPVMFEMDIGIMRLKGDDFEVSRP